jgi:hypothetical protein
MIRLFLLLILIVESQSNPWPINPKSEKLWLGYGVSDYDAIYRGEKRIKFARDAGMSGKGVTNESLSLWYYKGLNLRDTFVFSTRYSKIGEFLPLQAPSVSKISDTYLGFKRSYHLGKKVAMAYEAGILLTGDYVADFVTAPGWGTTEFQFAWHWGKRLCRGQTLGFSSRYIYRKNSPPNGVKLDLDWSKQLNRKNFLRTFLSWDASVNGVTLFDASSGWKNFSFDRKNEMQLNLGAGLYHQVKKDLCAFVLVSRKLDGRNTDKANYSLMIGVGIDL